uniref:Pectinesterase n=1 Tax=Oryza glaberrima TaxID=4538 RepID=I1R1X3_ORYGL
LIVLFPQRTRILALNPFHLSGAYYGVYKCSGPGLEASKKMGWAKELTDGFPYANQEFISGETWILPPPTPTD